MRKKNLKKGKPGQPTKYREEYCQKMIDFFNVPVTILDDKGHTIANDLPFFSTFACELGVHVDTLHEWRKVHPSFSEAYHLSQQYQFNILNQNTLKGRYSTAYAIFLAKNITQLRDSRVLEARQDTVSREERDSQILQLMGKVEKPGDNNIVDGDYVDIEYES